jgi:hypothetical protein
MIEPPYGKPWLLYGILGCSLALNLLMVVDRDSDPVEAEPAAMVDAPPSVDAAATAASTAAPADAPTDAPAATPVAVAEAPLVPTRDIAADAADWTIMTSTVSSTLSGAFRSAAGEDGSALSAVYSRLFVWDLDLRRDLRKGDRVDVAWRRATDDTIEVLAARLHSSKLGQTVAAYRWQAPGDAFTSYW